MLNLDRHPISSGQSVLSVSLLAFALLLYLVSFGGPAQHLAEICVMVLGFGAVIICRLEFLEKVSNAALDQQPVSKPQLPTLGVQALAANLKPEDMVASMANVVWATPAVASPTGQTADLELAELIPAETTPSATPQADTIFDQAPPIAGVSVDLPSFESRLWMQEVDVPVAEAVVVTMPAEPPRRYKDAIAEIGTRHICKFELGLSPLVFGPAAEVIPIIDACLPANSLCDVTARSREIILFGRAIYETLSSKCSQKRFVKAVMDASDSMRVARNLKKLGVSYDIYYGTLTGKNPSLEVRLAILMPVDAYAQLTLL